MSNSSSPAHRKWRVTVLRGGPSAEREISLTSGRAVAAAVRSLGHHVTEADIGPDDLAALDVPADIVFPVLHGRFGEDGQLQAILERRGLRFVGSDSEASRLSMNKDAAKRKWHEAGLPTAPWTIVTRVEPGWCLPDGLEPPVFLKPIEEGSSIGVRACDTRAALEADLPKVVSEFGPVLVERRLSGPEVTVGILGNDPLPVVQVRPATDFYDFKAKYSRNDTAYLLPAELDAATCRVLQDLAVRAFHVLGCRDFSRIDLIVDQRDGPQLLEINTIPGFTDHSLLPKAAAHVGISFERLVQMLLEMAWARRG